MRRYFEACSSAAALCVTLTLALILIFVVFPAVPIGGEVLDAKGRYTYGEALAALQGYGETGRETYAWASATLDTLLPLLYVSFLAGLVYRCRPTDRSWRLAYLPVVVGVIDLGENVQIVLMLTTYPDISAGQVAIASLFTSCKGHAALICLTLAITLAVVSWIRRVHTRIRDDLG
ncbi:MAG: hypothetical protein OXN89_24665 [Bryobacterales bacterium]|nr:hypothetical protein [Bryobacterales bacterium]